ncbi:hypothetical protein V8D89_003367 [Ganoderma adspersum]
MASVSGPSTARKTSLVESQTRISSWPSDLSWSFAVNGHEETAKICARFISHLFQCSELLPRSTTTPSTCCPPLPNFIARILHKSRPSSVVPILANTEDDWQRSSSALVAFAALFLLRQLKSQFPESRGNLGDTGHRLFLSAFILAHKVLCDTTNWNRTWSTIIGNMFLPREVNQMERYLCDYLDWKVGIEGIALKDLRAFEANAAFRVSATEPFWSFHLSTPSHKSYTLHHFCRDIHDAPLSPPHPVHQGQPSHSSPYSMSPSRRHTAPTPSTPRSVGRSSTMPPSGDVDALAGLMSRFAIDLVASPLSTCVDHLTEDVTDGVIEGPNETDSQSSPSTYVTVLELWGVPAPTYGGGTIGTEDDDNDDQLSSGDDVLELNERPSGVPVRMTSPSWTIDISDQPPALRQNFARAIPSPW